MLAEKAALANTTEVRAPLLASPELLQNHLHWEKVQDGNMPRVLPRNCWPETRGCLTLGGY